MAEERRGRGTGTAPENIVWAEHHDCEVCELATGLAEVQTRLDALLSELREERDQLRDAAPGLIEPAGRLVGGFANTLDEIISRYSSDQGEGRG